MPNKIQVAAGTALIWAPSGGTYALAMTSLANGAGYYGDRADLGAGVTERLWEWQFRYRTAAVPAIGEVVRVYLATGRDGTYQAGALGTTTAALSSEDLLRNVDPLGAVEVDQASTTKDFVRRGILYLRARYLVPAIWNACGQAFSGTAAELEFRLTPVSDEIQ